MSSQRPVFHATVAPLKVWAQFQGQIVAILKFKTVLFNTFSVELIKLATLINKFALNNSHSIVLHYFSDRPLLRLLSHFLKLNLVEIQNSWPWFSSSACFASHDVKHPSTDDRSDITFIKRCITLANCNTFFVFFPWLFPLSGAQK